MSYNNYNGKVSEKEYMYVLTHTHTHTHKSPCCTSEINTTIVIQL